MGEDGGRVEVHGRRFEGRCTGRCTEARGSSLGARRAARTEATAWSVLGARLEAAWSVMTRYLSPLSLSPLSS